MSILEIDSIELNFGKRKILQDIYLKCEVGSITGLIGRNGSGKSCLMKILFGSLKAASQSVRYDRQYIRRAHEVPGLIAFLPQDGFAMEYLTCEDLVSIFELDEASRNYLLTVPGIERHQKIRLSELSTGLRKLVEVLVVLLSPKKFVILDEPFSFLAPVLVEEVIRVIRNQAQYKGILLTDHLYQHVFEVCDRHYLLMDGAVRRVTNLSELTQYGYVTD